MSSHVILMVGLVLCVVGCAEKEQVSSEPMDEASKTTQEAVAPATAYDSAQNASFLAHMHHHAEKLDELNFALADGNLEAAVTPAHWLSRHDTVDDLPSAWMPYLYAMRTEAEVVENASDIETARAAAERINAQCQGCHAVAGISL